MNKVQILGTITREIEIKYTQSGSAIASFSIAHNTKYKDKSGKYVEKASFFDVVCFGTTAENLNKFFDRGSRILIDGELEYQSWTSSDGTKRSKVLIKMNSFDFIDRKQDGKPKQQEPAPSGYTPNGVPVYEEREVQPLPEIDMDDSIPF